MRWRSVLVQREPPFLLCLSFRLKSLKVAGAGVEPVAVSGEEASDIRHEPKRSGAVDARYGAFDADLQTVIDAWPGLDEKSQSRMCAIASDSVSRITPTSVSIQPHLRNG